MFNLTLNRLKDHHTVVDDKTDSECKSEQCDQIQALIQQIEGSKCGEQTDRYGKSDDEDGPPLSEEKVKDEQCNQES